MNDVEEIMPIIGQLSEQMRIEILFANRQSKEELNHALSKWNWGGERKDYLHRRPRILVVGNSQLKGYALNDVVVSLGLNPEDVDYYLGYKSKYRFSTLKDNDTYSDVLFGPLPHNQDGKGRSSSIITEMESKPSRWPNAVRLMVNGELKITKESFKRGLLNSKAYESICNLERINQY